MTYSCTPKFVKTPDDERDARGGCHADAASDA
eukprot:SAG11_NODE_36057_length_263_cov_1.256098_1_plen_31_part_01